MQDHIESLRVERGDELCVIVDEPASGPARGDVVLGPVFGATAYSMFPFAYALACNGFRVLRPDFRNHVGLSTGSIQDMLMSQQATDLTTALDLTDEPLLVAVSLSARPAIRALSLTAGVAGAVLVEPVVDTRATLLQVIGEDLLHGRTAELPDSVLVLDYMVNPPSFIPDCLEHGLASLRDTVAEVERLDLPLTFVAGDADPWVRIEDVKAVAGAHQAAGKDTVLVTIPAASHRLNRNPAVAARYIESMARECIRLRGSADDVTMPTFNEMMEANSDVRSATRAARSAGASAQAG